MKLKDMKISSQLRIAMGAILLFVAILGATAWFQADDLWQETKGLYEHPLQVRRALSTLAIDILTMHRDMKDLVMADNEQERQSIIQAIDTNEVDAMRQFDILYDRYLGSRKDIDEIRTAFVAWKPIRTETIRLLRAGKTTEALRRTKVNGLGGGQVEKLLDEIQHAINFARDKADKFYADAQHTKDSLIMQMWIVFGVIFLLTLGVSYILLKNIENPLQELTSLTEQFGQGKLDVRSRHVSANEFGNLAASFNALATTIQTEWLNKESAARLIEELHESNAYLENLINYANAPIIVWDPQFRITRFNHAFEFLTGRSEADVLGKSLELLFPTALVGDSMALIRKTMTGERWESVEIKILHRDESVRTVLWNSATIFTPDGQTPIATIAQGHNITLRKQMEEELLRARKLESLGVLAGGIAHDFNNLLGVVQGYIDLVLTDLPPGHGSRQLLQTAMRSVVQTRDLTSRLITFSRGGGPIKEILDVTEIIRETVQRTVKETKVRVNFDFREELWPAEVDDHQMKQVFNNLTRNAVEATPAGGILTIQAENALLPAGGVLDLQEGAYLKITFTDEGVGIHEDHLAKIFDPYFSTKSLAAQNGLGLGLAVCYSVLKSHDGHITVQSLPGEGASFVLYIPARPELAKDTRG